jgi:hypothetical protein
MTQIEVTHIDVGVPLAPTDIANLPVGTVIASHREGGTTFTRQPDGLWTEREGARRHNWDAFGNGYHVRHYPDGVEVTPETTSEYMWRFRNTTLKAAHSHSVSVSAVTTALAEMGAGMEALPLRVGQSVSNEEDIYNLPERTLVHVGIPSAYNSYGLFQVLGNGHGTRHVLGAQRQVPRHGVVIAELPDGYEPPVVEETDAALAAFKVRAYVIGLKVKGAQDWCSTYEAIVAPLGITAEGIRPLITGHEMLGSKVNPEGAAALPLGTVLKWENSDHTACSWFMRVENAGNKAGTRRIFCHANEGVTGRPGHFAGSMTVASVPLDQDVSRDIDMLAQVDGLNVVDHFEWLPPGTIISWRATQFYSMHRDQRASNLRYVPGTPAAIGSVGQYHRGSFGSPEDLRVVAFPTPTTTTAEVLDDQPF